MAITTFCITTMPLRKKMAFVRSVRGVLPALLAAKKYGRDWHYCGELTVKFVAPVCPGDLLRVALADDGKAECSSQFGTTLVGSATLR